MANKFEIFQGKVHYNSLQRIDKYGKWSLKLYLDNPSLERFRLLQAEKGILTRLNHDDEGWSINLGRPQEKEYGPKKIIFDPVIVTERDGKTPFRERLGYGTDVTCEVEVYPYTIPAGGGKKGHALRLASVRVDNLVPFNVQEHASEAEKKQMQGIHNTPPQAAY